MALHWTVAESSLGPVAFAAGERGVCWLAFASDGAELAQLFPKTDLIKDGERVLALKSQVLAAVENPGAAADIPIDVSGTPFQRRVWEELCRIPAGETRSYRDIAVAVGSPKAMRAVGSANGANPVAVLIPCHRVIRADGTLGGYGFGAETKRALLAREGARIA